MARGTVQHHAIGSIVSERAPLDQILREACEGAFSRLICAKVTMTERAECVLLRELMDGGRGRACANRVTRRGARQITAHQRWRQPAEFAGGVDASQSERGHAGDATRSFGQIAAGGAKGAVAIEAAALTESPNVLDADLRAIVPAAAP